MKINHYTKCSISNYLYYNISLLPNNDLCLLELELDYVNSQDHVVSHAYSKHALADWTNLGSAQE